MLPTPKHTPTVNFFPQVSLASQNNWKVAVQAEVHRRST